VTTLITCKYNPDFSCCDFNGKLKSNKDFLKKVLPADSMIWQMRKFTNDSNIVLFLSKLHYFSFSW